MSVYHNVYHVCVCVSYVCVCIVRSHTYVIFLMYGSHVYVCGVMWCGVKKSWNDLMRCVGVMCCNA